LFRSERWAGAFIGVSGENAAAAFLCLKALAAPLKSVSVRGVFFGKDAAARVEKLLRDGVCAGAGSAPGGTPGDPAAECAIRFVTLLIEKNCFRHIDLVLQKIERRMDEQAGILDVTVESAAPMDSAFEEEMRRSLMQRTGAAGVKMKTRLVPELLGGYRLRIGGFCVDASLKGQMEQMKADMLEAVRTAMAAARGGGNGEL
jgi:F-type H+-transporting ATPase subunit delta